MIEIIGTEAITVETAKTFYIFEYKDGDEESFAVSQGTVVEVLFEAEDKTYTSGTACLCRFIDCKSTPELNGVLHLIDKWIVYGNPS